MIGKKRFIISSQSPGGLESLVHPNFTKCDYFTVVTFVRNQIKEDKVVFNRAKQATKRADILAVRTIIKLGADLIITGNVWSNELDLFQQLGIQVAISGITKVRIAVKKYLEGDLPVIPISNLSYGTGKAIRVDLDEDMNLIQKKHIFDKVTS